MIFNKANLLVHTLADKKAGPSHVSNQVHITEGFTEFTDGHVLVRITTPLVHGDDLPDIDGKSLLESISEERGFIIGAPAAQEIEKTIKPMRTLPILENTWLTNGTNAEFMSTDLETHRPSVTRKHDGPFVDTDRVIPEGEAAVTLAWSPDLMQKTMAYLKKIGVTKIKVEVYNATSPIKFTGTVMDTGQEITALLMPMKI